MSVFPFLGSILTHCLSHDNRALLLLCIVPQAPGQFWGQKSFTDDAVVLSETL
jgi:hypothetical protein